MIENHGRVTMKKRVALFAELISKVRPGQELIGAEIGVWKADWSVSVCLTVPRVRWLYCIDPYKWFSPGGRARAQRDWDAVFHRVREAIENTKLSQRIVQIRGTSDEAAPLVGALDFVHIDGNHYEEFVRRDIQTYGEKLRPGGLMLGHDYNYKGVKAAVNDLLVGFSTSGLVTNVDPVVDTWWWYK